MLYYFSREDFNLPPPFFLFLVYLPYYFIGCFEPFPSPKQLLKVKTTMATGGEIEKSMSSLVQSGKLNDSERGYRGENTEVDSSDPTSEIYSLAILAGDKPENRKIYDWIEEMVGSQFLQERADDGANNGERQRRKFSLLEFELGKEEEPSEDDLLRSSFGEGMVIPLKVVYSINDVRTSNNLLMRLPRYFYDFAEDFYDTSSSSIPLVAVHTNETYFYSKVLPDIKDFLKSEDVDLKLAIPQCFYVKHCPKYEMKKTPALIENLMTAKSLLLLLDPRGEGFNELESVEDVDLQKGLAVMTEMAKLHAVSWAIQEKTGRDLNELWQDLLTVRDQEAINDHVIQGSFEILSNHWNRTESMDEEAEGDGNLVMQLIEMKPKIVDILKQTLYASGPSTPSALLHMMIGGPNLFFRKKHCTISSTSGNDQTEYKDMEMIECNISNWGLATIGNPILDIAIFTCVSLASPVRNQYSDLFLQQYWQSFETVAQALQVTPKFDFRYVVKEFEKFQIWAYLFMIAACKQSDMHLEEITEIVGNILDILTKILAEEQ